MIIGDGPMGLIHLQLFKRLSHSRAAIVGKIPLRMEKARRWMRMQSLLIPVKQLRKFLILLEILVVQAL